MKHENSFTNADWVFQDGISTSDHTDFWIWTTFTIAVW